MSSTFVPPQQGIFTGWVGLSSNAMVCLPAPRAGSRVETRRALVSRGFGAPRRRALRIYGALVRSAYRGSGARELAVLM